MLDDFTPSFDLILTYSSKHQVVQLGNKIKPSAVQSAPNVEIFARPSTLAPTRTLSSNVSYTLALTDPDATSRVDPKMGEMCHWLVTGIRLPAESHEFHAKPAVGSTRGHVHFQGENLDGEATEELMPYKPPAPPPKTGYHRYVFVLLAPASEDASKELKKPKDRPHWGYGKIGKGVRDWAEDNDLVPVGMQIHKDLENSRRLTRSAQEPIFSGPKTRSSETFTA